MLKRGLPWLRNVLGWEILCQPRSRMTPDWVGRERPLLVIITWVMFWDTDWDWGCHSPHPDSCWEPTSAPFIPAILASGEKVLVLGAERTALRTNGVNLDLALKVSAPATWDLTPPPTERSYPLRRETLAHVFPALSLLFAAPCPTRLIVASTTSRRICLMLRSDPALWHT